MLFELRIAIEENRNRALAFAGKTKGEQFVHEGFQFRIIKAFAECMVEFDAEPRINRVELLLRQRNHLVPDFQVFRVPALEFHEFLTGGVPDGFHGFAGGADHFIEPLHLADGIGFQRVGLELMFPAEQQHSELCAPVADVVVGDDTVTQEA